MPVSESLKGTEFSHVYRGLVYAEKVVSGEIPAGHYTAAACQRQLDDLCDQELFSFDVEKAERICRFVEMLPHTKGKWARSKKPIKLEPWQSFFLSTLFGWVDERGRRRFWEAYAEIPRKNGKSIIAAGVGLFMLGPEDEHGAEVYSGATTEKQAWEVFKPAKMMAQKTPDFTDFYEVQVNAKSLTNIETGAKFEPLIGNPGDGSSPSCAIVDEYHEHPTDDLYETMKTGMGARENPLMLIITTAGYNIASPCYDKRIEAAKVLDRVDQDDRLFSIIYHADKGDEWDAPETLKKANPNLGISVSEDYLLGQLATAKNNPRKQRAYQTKHLNLWGGAKEAWLNLQAWHECGDSAIKEADFLGESGFFAVDLASRIDMAAFGRVYVREIDGKPNYYLFSDYYLPEDTINDDKTGNYAKWVREGWLKTVEGNEIDFSVIRQDVYSSLDDHPMTPVVFDPWRATQLAQELSAEDVEVMEFRNSPRNATDPMKEMEAAVVAGRFHHNNNPITTWMASNVVTKLYPDDMMKPSKEKPEQKIDGIVAAIMAIAWAQNAEIQQGPLVAYV